MPNFKEKPQIFQAIQWDGKNIREMKDFDDRNIAVSGKTLNVRCVLDGVSYQAFTGDWVMKHPTGPSQNYLEVIPNDIFEKRFEKVD